MKKRRMWALCAAVLFVMAGCAKQSPSPQGNAPIAPKDDIVILFTNDVHGGIEDDIGYAGLVAYKEAWEAKTPYVSLVDCGDAVQGDFLGTISDGAYLVDIMNEVGYDMAILGNHEFDYGMQQLHTLTTRAQYPYLACNITYTGSGENALSRVKPYEIVTYGETAVAFIGVATPETITKSAPTNFIENGQYVYDFADGNDGEELYALVQKYTDECRSKGADYVVLLSHLGDAEEHTPFSSVDLIRETAGIDVVLDGHAHSTIPCRIEKNEKGQQVLLSSTGTKLNNIGQLVITANGKITVGLVSDYAEKDPEFETFYNTMEASFAAEMNEVIAVSDMALVCQDENGVRLVRNRETPIGNFCADAYRAVTGADIAMINGGGIRADLPAGEITYEDILAVNPFGNTLCMVTASGQEILDCLEVACQYTQAEVGTDGIAVGENGSFQHVSGLKYSIDTAVPSSVEFDENGMLASIGNTRRVKDVQVLQEDGTYVPLDPNATYTVASHNHLLIDCGGGINVFADNEFLIQEGIADYQALVVYITEHLNGKLGERYAAVEGRIVVQ